MEMCERFQFAPMKLEHVKAAATLRVAFRDFGYMSKMHVGFWEFFLSKIIELPEVIAHVAIDIEKQTIVGYIIGTTNDVAIRKYLMSWPSSLITFWFMVRMFMNHPRQIIVLAKGLLKRSKKSIVSSPQRWITWIVDDNYKQRGIGLGLYRHLCTRMYNAGVSNFYGSVDCCNDASNSAHIKFGAKNIGTLVIDGRCHYLWKHDSAKWSFNRR